MLNFSIPDEFKQKFEGNFALDGLVKSCISEFGEWLKENNVKFFAEYTDHSIQHVENVLSTANRLIRDECREFLTVQDISTLIIATFLHDSAMHLSIDGFINLVTNEQENRIINGFGDKPWKVLWIEYLAEARRFSGRKLTALFGDAKPVVYPAMNPQDMSGRDLLLIGEFLRRHHHRLAHEIARFGVPGPKEEKLKIRTTPETEPIVDLAGLVARSHGMAIRDCYSYVENTYGGLKSTIQVHPIYLMALLRLADIIQIDSNRAPRYVEKLRDIRSPVSQNEWELHHSIKDINFDEYPETILITARPENVKTYAKTRKLLDQIQKELDSSWTAIGEIYGFDKRFREFGLTIRRVRSNIDDIEKFQQQVDYIPCEASFEVADSDLLKLLIAPLYGDDPAIGIRELVQNAIDAVRELKAFQQMRPEFQNIDLTEQDGDVVVSIDQESDGKWWFAISDRGIGMRLQTVKDYFLKAGASLRRSDLWRKTFEDDKGNSKVLRSGRFGVGALAAFLLGKEIRISTRYIEDLPENGIKFSTQIDSEVIELQKATRPVGTTIRICITEQIKEKLVGENKKKDEILIEDASEDFEKDDHWLDFQSQKKPTAGWDWYCLSKPQVIRIFQNQNLKQNINVPDSGCELPSKWRRITHQGYEDIQWVYDDKFPELICNGLKIQGKYSIGSYGTISYQEKETPFIRPAIVVFDPNANLPLNLERTALAQRFYPFEDALAEDIFKDFISYVLVNAPLSVMGHLNEAKPYTQLAYPGYYATTTRGGLRYIDDVNLGFSPWYTCNQGIGIADDYWNMKKLGCKSALIVSGYHKYISSKGRITEHQATMHKITTFKSQVVGGYFINDDSKIKGYSQVLRDIMIMGTKRAKLISKIFGVHLNQIDDSGENKIFFNPILKNAKRILFSRANYEKLSKISNDPDYGVSLLKHEDHINLAIEWENENWILWKMDECPDADFDFIKFSEENSPDDSWPCLLAELYFEDTDVTDDVSAFSKLWEKIIGSPTIPLDLEARREKLSHVYKQLETYIKAHEQAQNGEK